MPKDCDGGSLSYNLLVVNRGVRGDSELEGSEVRCPGQAAGRSCVRSSQPQYAVMILPQHMTLFFATEY